MPGFFDRTARTKILWEIKVPGDVHEVVPLPQGHLLIACGEGHKVMELDASEKVVWEVNENDLPGHPLRLMTGCQRLPNGNTILCNWLGHGDIGEQADVVALDSADCPVVLRGNGELAFGS